MAVHTSQNTFVLLAQLYSFLIRIRKSLIPNDTLTRSVRASRSRENHIYSFCNPQTFWLNLLLGSGLKCSPTHTVQKKTCPRRGAILCSFRGLFSDPAEVAWITPVLLGLFLIQNATYDVEVSCEALHFG